MWKKACPHMSYLRTNSQSPHAEGMSYKGYDPLIRKDHMPKACPYNNETLLSDR